MSLTLSENTKPSIPLLEEGTYPAICFLMVDLGLQYNETFGKNAKKIAIGWELPGETITIDGVEQPRTFINVYTASLNSKGNLRRDLKAWRGRDFTLEELKAFDLKSIIGVPCLIGVIHNEASNGNTYVNLSSISRLPKGFAVPEGRLSHVIYDIDENDPREIANLPNWMQEMITKSQSYIDRINSDTEAGKVVELPGDDEEGLPF